MHTSDSFPRSNGSTLDRECVSLLPRVCELLATSENSLPDDTSLEKLLDWFTQLTKAGTSLHESFPCLLEFTSTAIKNTSSDPEVLSFMIKLTGLMAANEEGFHLLQACTSLDKVFNIKHWQEAGLWEDPSIKIGWVQGLRCMMQHQRALSFFTQSELTEHLLQLQTDSSLFVASAASQLLAHILLFYQPDSSTGNGKENKSEDEDSTHNSLNLSAVSSTEYAAALTMICVYFKESLLQKERKQLHQSGQVLKLVAQLLTEAHPPLRDQLMESLSGSVEALVTAGYSQLTQPLMDVILAAHSSEQGVSRLLSAMLGVSQPTELVRAAAAVLHRGLRNPVHTPKAVRILLLPIDIVTGQSVLGSDAEERWCQMLEQLRNKPSCTSMICVCLTNIPQITLLPPDFLPCSPALIVTAVVSLLHISIGDSSSSSSSSAEAVRNITGNGKVQKCALEALTALSNCSEGTNKVSDVFTVLLLYLENPNSHPTALHKCYQALVKWTSVCTELSSISDQFKQDLIQVVRKRVCDMRWEVRDSTVEFLGQMAGVKFSADSDQTLLDECSTILLLREALQDQESYVRASAISALARTLKKSWQQGAALSQEQTDIVTKLLDILSDDTEGFPRRAVVQYFISWYSSHSASPSSLLMTSLHSLLSRGSSDLDWEVKVHTLELSELLINAALSGQRGDTQDKPLSHPYAMVSEWTKTPHTHGQTGDFELGLEAALGRLVEWGVVCALLRGLFDCDRPVGLKACQLLIKLRETLNPSTLEASAVEVRCELPSWGWGREVRTLLGTLHLNGTEKIDSGCEVVSVCELLRCLSLDERLSVLSQSSDHVHNSPLSLLQDILTARDVHLYSGAAEGQEVIVDCY